MAPTYEMINLIQDDNNLLIINVAEFLSTLSTSTQNLNRYRMSLNLCATIIREYVNKHSPNPPTNGVTLFAAENEDINDNDDDYTLNDDNNADDTTNANANTNNNNGDTNNANDNVNDTNIANDVSNNNEPMSMSIADSYHFNENILLYFNLDVQTTINNHLFNDNEYNMFIYDYALLSSVLPLKLPPHNAYLQFQNAEWDDCDSFTYLNSNVMKNTVELDGVLLSTKVTYCDIRRNHIVSDFNPYTPSGLYSLSSFNEYNFTMIKSVVCDFVGDYRKLYAYTFRTSNYCNLSSNENLNNNLDLYRFFVYNRRTRRFFRNCRYVINGSYLLIRLFAFKEFTDDDNLLLFGNLLTNEYH